MSNTRISKRWVSPCTRISCFVVRERRIGLPLDCLVCGPSSKAKEPERWIRGLSGSPAILLPCKEMLQFNAF
jgi:hypothetical protein